MTPQRTAVVTGAGSERGIGRATARRLAEDGWAIVVLDLDADAATEAADAIGSEYDVATFAHDVDVADQASVDSAQQAVSAQVPAGSCRRVGAVVNIAGITSPVPFLDTTLDLWNKVMAVNATGTYLVTKAFLPELLAAGWGRIITMSSVSAQRGGGVFGKVPYSAAKAAILGFTKALARELGDSGVTINAVAPGAVDTDIRVGSTDEDEAAIRSGIPVGRTATTREVASAIAYLCGEDAAYLTGTHPRHQRRQPPPLSPPTMISTATPRARPRSGSGDLLLDHPAAPPARQALAPSPASASPRSTWARCPGYATTCLTTSPRRPSSRSRLTVNASGLRVRSVNADVGDLNQPLDPGGQAARSSHVGRLIDLSTAVGATGLVLPNGALRHEPVTSLASDLTLVTDQVTGIAGRCAAAGLQLWIEAPHYFRLCYDLRRTALLLALLPSSVGVICDVSHIVASGSTARQFVELVGSRISHVHLRDAEPGYIHHSIGNGQVDFADTIAALEQSSYGGAYSLELETRDVSDSDRPAAALTAGRYISTLLAERSV